MNITDTFGPGNHKHFCSTQDYLDIPDGYNILHCLPMKGTTVAHLL